MQRVEEFILMLIYHQKATFLLEDGVRNGYFWELHDRIAAGIIHLVRTQIFLKN